MSAELGVIVTHGMGTGREGDVFADDMIAELEVRLSDLGKAPGSVAFKTVFWADLLEKRQKRYLRAARQRSDLDYMQLRRFIVSALGDAAAYPQSRSAFNTVYQEVHDRIADALYDLRTDELGGRDRPLIVLAHSLGAQIMSDHIWDAQHADPAQAAESRFERMETLVGFVTFGSTLPLSTFAYENPEPIRFPPRRLSAALRSRARWLNFYDPSDVLGYPLKPINARYRATVNRDIEINVGNPISSWNPLAHLGYWTDNSFTRPVSRLIASFL